MCDPVTMTVMSVAQAGMSIQGQKQQADAQRQVQRNASEAERRRYLNEAASQRIRDAQQSIADAQKIQFNQRQGIKTKATARTAAGEAGVTGQAVSQLIQSIDRQQAGDNFAIQQNIAMRNVQSDLRLRDMGLNHQNNLLRINKPIDKPNVLGALMDGAQFGMQMGALGKEAGLEGFFGKKTTTPKVSSGTLNMNTRGQYNLSGDMLS